MSLGIEGKNACIGIPGWEAWQLRSETARGQVCPQDLGLSWPTRWMQGLPTVLPLMSPRELQKAGTVLGESNTH